MKTIIVYGSTMGNTKTMAVEVGKVLRGEGFDVELRDVNETPVTFLQDFEFIILGASTWGDGELQDDFIDFEQSMEAIDLAGKKAAVFGPGESSYTYFCKAVDVLEDRLKKCGAFIIGESLKIDGDVDSQLSEVTVWADGISKNMASLKI